MTTYYIAPTTHATTPGNDTTGNGSSGTPWATISKAHTSAASGDTIIVKAGGSIAWTTQTFTKNLTIQGESMPVYSPITRGWTGATFSGGGSTGVRWLGNTTLTLIDLIFMSAGPGSDSTNSSLFNNSTLTMRRCIGYNLIWDAFINTRTGVIATPRPAYVITIDACVFYAPASGNTGLLSNNGLTGPFSTGSVTLTNSVIYAANPIMNLDSGFSMPVTIKNNIIVNTGTAIALINNASSGTVYSNNCAYGFSSAPSGSNNITSNPQFIDPANGDFNTRPGAPPTNAGVAL